MDSAFKPFKLELSSDRITTGIACIPSTRGPHATHPQQGAKPLIVGLHGGACTPAYFDLLPGYSASTFSEMTGIPFVAINRPCYADSTSVLPLQENEPFFAKTGTWLHEAILPAIWKEFGITNDCSGMVLISHSMAVPPTVFCAGLHADEQDSTALYPLAGIILTGWGVEHVATPPKFDIDQTTGWVMPQWPEAKIDMMLGPLPTPDCHPEVLKAVLKRPDLHNVPVPPGEGGQTQLWFRDAEELSAKVRVPVLYAGGDKDRLWTFSPATVEAFAKRFTSSAKVDVKILHGAPHSLEWGRSAFGWYLQVFGWASEVCSELELSRKKA